MRILLPPKPTLAMANTSAKPLHGECCRRRILYKKGFSNLESASYGITPDAYRYLSSVIAGVQYSPVYAKMNVLNTILHHDIYLLGGGGLTIEQSFMPDKDMAYSPTLALGVGARIFLPSGSLVRIQLRDDIMMQSRQNRRNTRQLF